MNKIYRLIWNTVHHSWVPASEVSKSRGKANGQRSRLTHDNTDSRNLSLSMGLSVTLLSLAGPVMAQPQIKADGITVTENDALTVDTAASNSAGYGLWATNGGKTNANGGADVTTRGANAPAAMAEGADSAISINGGTLQNNGNLGNAASDDINSRYATVTARDQGSVVLNGVSVANNYKNTSNKLVGTALLAQSTGSSIQMTGGQLSGDEGAQAKDGGTVVLTNVAVTGSSQGLYADEGGSVITVNGGSIDMVASGFRGEAVLVSEDSTINLNGVDITTSNANSGSTTGHGVLVMGAGTANIDNSTIHTYGSNANGVQIGWSATSYIGGTVNINGGSIVSDAGAGVLAQGSDSTANITGGTITGAKAGLSLKTSAQSAATNSQIIATDDSAHGVHVEGGSSATLNGGSVTVTGDGAYGLYTTGTGSYIKADGTTIRSTGSGGSVVSAQAGSRIDLQNLDVIGTEGERGIYAGIGVTSAQVTADNVNVKSSARGVNVDAGGNFAMTSGSIESTGDAVMLWSSTSAATGAVATISNATLVSENGYGININGRYASATLNNVDILTKGDYDVAVWLPSQDTTLVANNTNFKTLGAQAVAIDNRGGNVVLTGGSVTTTGSNSHALYASHEYGTTASISATDMSIKTSGAGAVGAISRITGANVQLDNVSIETTGNLGHGLFASGTDAVMGVRNSTVTTSGEGAYGLNLSNRALVSLDSTNISTSGADAAAVWSYTTVAGTDRTNVLPVNNSRLETQDAPAILVSGGNHDLAFADSTVIGRKAGDGNDGTLLSARAVTVSGVVMPTFDVSLKATRSNLVGDVLVDSGKATVTLNDGSTLSGAMMGSNDGVVDSVSVDATSGWNIRGDSEVGMVRNAGTLAFVAPISDDGFKTLTIKGDYVGDGGTLVMNTALGDDDSLTDRLIVEGDTRGDTFVQVKNAKGAGAQTDNGIQLISVAGASEGVFELEGRAVAGLYDYQLYKGGKHTPDDGGWYLRSEALPVPIDPPTTPVDPETVDPPPVAPDVVNPPTTPVDPETVDPPPVAPDVVNPPTTPVDPEIVDPPVPVDPVIPALRPEPAAYLGNQNAALRMFQHTMHDRVGEPGLGAREDGRGYATWVRVQNRNLDAGTVGGQIAIDTNATVLQMGVEKQFAAGEGRVHAGVMGGYGRATTDATSNFTDHKSRGEVKGTNLGVYGTWFQNAEGPEGLYVDGWVQYGRFDNTVKGDYLGRERYDSRTWSGSVEAGYAMRVHSGERYGVYVEPQAQVIYTDFSSDDVREDNGTLVQSRKAGGTTTRLGARVYSRALEGGKNRVQPFAAVNWWSGGNASTIAMDGDRLSRDLPKNTYEAKVGAQLELGKGWSGWGQVGYQQGSNGYRDVNGQVGVKLSW